MKKGVKSSNGRKPTDNKDIKQQKEKPKEKKTQPPENEEIKKEVCVVFFNLTSFH